LTEHKLYAFQIVNTNSVFVTTQVKHFKNSFELVLLRGTLFRIVSVVQHLSSDSFRGKYLKRRNYLRAIKHAKRSRDASWFCAI